MTSAYYYVFEFYEGKYHMNIIQTDKVQASRVERKWEAEKPHLLFKVHTWLTSDLKKRERKSGFSMMLKELRHDLL